MDQEEEKWTLLDVLRVLAGLLVVIGAVAWQMGAFEALKGSKWGSWRQWKHIISGSPITEYTVEELKETKAMGETLVAINGTVYDVSSNARFYRASRYDELLGQDCTSLFLTGLFGQNACSHVWEHNEHNIRVVADWEALYNRKYVRVGILVF